MSLKIRLTRSENKDEDDTILIRRRQGSGFVVRFVDGTAPKTVWISEKTSFEVIDYLQRILAGLNDIDPFKGIQLDIPGYPLVYRRVSDISPEVPNILETVREWLMNPPSSFSQ
jgi:hypothetical protein